MIDYAIVSAGFDPIHSGHISLINDAATHAKNVIVIVNSDEWLRRKKGEVFLPARDRISVASALKNVAKVYYAQDDDDTVIKTIKNIVADYPNSTIAFANGGDRTASNTPEHNICLDLGIKVLYGVGGSNKLNSSSKLLQAWALSRQNTKTLRQWGYYRILHEPNSNVKLKELTVEPGKSLSMQRHFKRSEYWFVSEGVATVSYIDEDTNSRRSTTLARFASYTINGDSWHQLSNNTDDPLRIIEIQYGTSCDETDIERKD